MVGGGWHGLLDPKRIEKISMWKLEAVRAQGRVSEHEQGTGYGVPKCLTRPLEER